VANSPLAKRARGLLQSIKKISFTLDTHIPEKSWINSGLLTTVRFIQPPEFPFLKGDFISRYSGRNVGKDKCEGEKDKVRGLWQGNTMTMKTFAEILLRGMSQVFLLNNVATGILFFAAIGYSSWFMGIGAMIGVLVGTFSARLLKYDSNDIQQGLYGYNGALVGLAIICFFGFNLPSVLALVFGAALSSIIRKGMSAWKVPPYTTPFIISTWIVMSLLIIFNIIPLQAARLSDARNVEIIPAVTKGMGQVMFLENVIAGIIVFVGILVSSRITACYALLGSSIGVAVAFASSFPLNMINIGMFGFNAVLCGIAFSGKKWTSLILAMASGIISVFMMYGIMKLGTITLTAPFVVSTWLVLLISRRVGAKHLL